MTLLPVEVLIGISYGLLIGTVLAFGLGLLSFCCQYYADRSLTQIATIGIALPSAAFLGYAMEILEVSGEATLRLLISTVVITMLALYATSQGDRLATAVPRENAQPTVRARTLSIEAIDSVDAMGQVTIRPTGGVRDVDGYPPLAPGLRKTLEDETWRLPVDLPLPALESRLEARLRTAYDLESVSVSVDARGRASIAAAPPMKGVAKHVPDGWRAISITALLPSGVTAGDRVRIETVANSVEGTVLSTMAPTDALTARAAGVDGTESTAGEGRLTVAVPTAESGSILDADRACVAVVPDGTSQAFETLSMLERAGKTVRRVVLDDGAVDDLLADGSAMAFAVRESATAVTGNRWQFEPDPSTLEPGDEVVVIGDRTWTNDFETPAGALESSADRLGVIQ